MYLHRILLRQTHLNLCLEIINYVNKELLGKMIQEF